MDWEVKGTFRRRLSLEHLADARVGVVMSAPEVLPTWKETRRLTFDAVGMAFMLCPSSQ